jgi:hypothetical protein
MWPVLSSLGPNILRNVADPFILQPLLHAIIFFIELAMAARLIAKFNSYYAQKPVLTTMITNAVCLTLEVVEGG